jgi:hypothetical protein
MYFDPARFTLPISCDLIKDLTLFKSGVHRSYDKTSHMEGQSVPCATWLAKIHMQS